MQFLTPSSLLPFAAAFPPGGPLFHWQLLEFLCQHVAEIIKNCGTPEEVRRRFKIKDPTPEEEQWVRETHAWAFNK